MKEEKIKFINSNLYVLLTALDPGIADVKEELNEAGDDVRFVVISYPNSEIRVNVECDSPAAIVKDVINKLFF